MPTRATRNFHPSNPSTAKRGGSKRKAGDVDAPIAIPTDAGEVELAITAERSVRLTNLDKPFWPELGLTKRNLLQYYADVAPYLLPHLAHRAMVMKRYPNGAAGDFFFMKRTPSPRPPWLETCAIEHESG